MVLRGIVSSIGIEGTRATFPDKENAVSAPLLVAVGVGTLEIGDYIVVVFFSDNMQDGLILAKY
ncbi:hypothetical protein E4K67_17485 [Desulfosporosinus fructosivorans]|uniref:Uncharacterized protein n=1 Tax=Desulfosporosinus fructosivorans TaxID=2018669 RepID=A0A4Z0R1F3_9FIRM|nr:hypothetical protein [Desulfosporosinus fructosivorans]TGE36892.1 hypothetical protein E4K67_17485 [Desulfosporosinus fructosivorans]